VDVYGDFLHVWGDLNVCDFDASETRVIEFVGDHFGQFQADRLGDSFVSATFHFPIIPRNALKRQCFTDLEFYWDIGIVRDVAEDLPANSGERGLEAFESFEVEAANDAVIGGRAGGGARKALVDFDLRKAERSEQSLDERDVLVVVILDVKTGFAGCGIKNCYANHAVLA